jgi:aromatic ring-opening dioxygenase LigB subunit
MLIPSIGKDKHHALDATRSAYRRVEERLYALGAETLVIISPHASCYPNAFSANMAESFTGTLKAFGDHQTTVRVPSDILLLDRIQSVLRERGDIPFTLTSNEELDYGITIPLLLLTEHLKDIDIVPLAPSLLDAQTHVEFGRALKEILHESSRRIACIASADLSHKLEGSPAGTSVEGPAFDATIRSKIKTMDIEALLALDPEAVEEAGQCGYRPIMTLLGIFDTMNVTPTELCYEAPFGVGYLTELFELA